MTNPNIFSVHTHSRQEVNDLKNNKNGMNAKATSRKYNTSFLKRMEGISKMHKREVHTISAQLFVLFEDALKITSIVGKIKT